MVGIFITISIYLKQKELTKQFEEVRKEADFVRLNIKPELYTDIQRISNLLKAFVDIENINMGLGSVLEMVQRWRSIGDLMVQNADKIRMEVLAIANKI